MNAGIRIFCIVLSCFFLQGCAEMALTGAGLAYDHYRVERSMHDRYIAMQIESALYAVPEVYENSSISIAVFNKMALLTGQVKTDELHDHLADIVGTVPDIKHLYNFVTVGDFASIGTNLNDSWITAKVKSQLIMTRDLDASNIKVVTDNGTVYLLGLLNPMQADKSIKTAQKTEGVIHVVTMFEYVHTTMSAIQKVS